MSDSDDPVLRIADRIGRGPLTEQDDEQAWLDAVLADAPGPDERHAPDPVTAELTRLRARRDAQAALDAETAQTVELPDAVRLDKFLAEDDEPVLYRIGDLWPAGGRVLFAAQGKAGKTTARDEAVRSLVDGVPFLGHFPVDPVPRVYVIDDEMDTRQLRAWLRAHGIVNTDRVDVLCLRGRVSAFDLMNASVLTRWAAKLAGVNVLFLDCLRPVLDALGLDENRDAGKFLVQLDRLCHLAGIGESMVIHHMGHDSERSRGDSRLIDWPEALWRLMRAKPNDDGTINQTRYFAATGRDVDVPETALDYDAATRRLSWSAGDRRSPERGATLRALLDHLHSIDPATATANELDKVLADLGHTTANARAARQWAVKHGCVALTRGGNKSQNHTLSASVRRSALSTSDAPGVECVSAYVEQRTRTHTHVGDEEEPLNAPHRRTCTVCGEPIDPAAGTTHPSCDPEGTPS